MYRFSAAKNLVLYPALCVILHLVIKKYSKMAKSMHIKNFRNRVYVGTLYTTH